MTLRAIGIVVVCIVGCALVVGVLVRGRRRFTAAERRTRALAIVNHERDHQ